MKIGDSIQLSEQKLTFYSFNISLLYYFSSFLKEENYVKEEITNKEMKQFESMGFKHDKIYRKLKFKNWPESEELLSDEILLDAIKNETIEETLITDEERMGSYV